MIHAKAELLYGSALAFYVCRSLLPQKLGNVGTILLALPVALLLGFGREAIGMTHSIKNTNKTQQEEGSLMNKKPSLDTFPVSFR